MSLIILESEDKQNPSYFKNNFRDGIEVKKGSEISLVSLSFNKDASYNILTGDNDSFRWVIGETPNYSLHTTVIPSGVYTGKALADKVFQLLTAQTVLQQYEWEISFDQAGNEGQGSFTVGYKTRTKSSDFVENFIVQQSGSNTFSYLGQGDTSITALGQRSTNNIVSPSSNNISVLTGGLYADGGYVDFLLKPTKSYTQTSFDVLETGTGPNIAYNESGFLSLWTLIKAPPVALAAGWNYRLESFLAPGSYIYWYYLPTDEGVIKTSPLVSDGNWGNDASDPSNWNDEFLYNDTEEDLRNAAAGNRTSSNGSGVGHVFSKHDGANIVKMGLTKNVLGYGSNKFGYCRNELYTSGLIGPRQPDGFDSMFHVQDNVSRTDVKFSLSQLIQDESIDYPQSGWRDDSITVFQNVLPGSLGDINTTPKPTGWSNFTYGEDYIGVRVEVDRSLSTSISV